MERLTDRYWRNLDPWECCGQDNYCQRGCHDEGGCANGCIVPKLYVRLAKYEDTGLKPEEIREAVDLFDGHTDNMPREIEKWAERAAWHVRKCNELEEKLRLYEQAEDEGRMLGNPRGEVGMIPKLLSLGAPVWFLFHDDDTGQWEIGQERITGAGIEGFWCSGLRDQPDAATYMTKWDEVGERAFFSKCDAEKAQEEANEG